MPQAVDLSIKCLLQSLSHQPGPVSGLADGELQRRALSRVLTAPLDALLHHETYEEARQLLQASPFSRATLDALVPCQQVKYLLLAGPEAAIAALGPAPQSERNELLALDFGHDATLSPLLAGCIDAARTRLQFIARFRSGITAAEEELKDLLVGIHAGAHHRENEFYVRVGAEGRLAQLKAWEGACSLAELSWECWQSVGCLLRGVDSTLLQQCLADGARAQAWRTLSLRCASIRTPGANLRAPSMEGVDDAMLGNILYHWRPLCGMLAAQGHWDMMIFHAFSPDPRIIIRAATQMLGWLHSLLEDARQRVEHFIRLSSSVSEQEVAEGRDLIKTFSLRLFYVRQSILEDIDEFLNVVHADSAGPDLASLCSENQAMASIFMPKARDTLAAFESLRSE